MTKGGIYRLLRWPMIGCEENGSCLVRSWPLSFSALSSFDWSTCPGVGLFVLFCTSYWQVIVEQGVLACDWLLGLLLSGDTCPFLWLRAPSSRTPRHTVVLTCARASFLRVC